MRLIEVTVQNFRSITQQTKFDVSDFTTLVGPNNEGKSNMLRALNLGMGIIERWGQLDAQLTGQGAVQGPGVVSLLRSPRYRLFRGASSWLYRWGDDFPLDKQASPQSHPTLVRLKFKLTAEEVEEFLDDTGITSNGELPIEIKLGRQSVQFGVVKQGRGAATHRAKSGEIAKFIAERISFVSVPAIRTGSQAMELVNQLATIKMRSTLASDEYQELTSKLNELRRFAVDEVARDLTTSVQRYVSSVKSINLRNADVERTYSIDELSIDDGTVTSIEHKGDGIKSLVTMALIQELAQEQARGHNLILAVDEPEAHLHPGTIHDLQRIFSQVSASQQVILATHNPIFVNRERTSANIVVKANSAKPANKVSEIREALGIELGDNLSSAETIVLVEGISDEQILPVMLRQIDQEIGRRVAAGQLVFKATRGAGKIRAQIQREKSTGCRIVAVLDDDVAGRTNGREISKNALLPTANVFLLGGRKTESELEDLICPDIYIHALTAEFGRVFTAQNFANRARTWTKNLEEATRRMGLPVSSDEIISRAKTVVAHAVTSADKEISKPESQLHLATLCKLILGKAE